MERDALDHDFVDRHTDGFEVAAEAWASLDWADHRVPQRAAPQRDPGARRRRRGRTTG
ncbi:MAG: hypothetical protein QM747_17080 [Nocardioides sp.]